MPKATERQSFKKYVYFFWILAALPFVFLFLILFLASKGYIGQELPTFDELENPRSNLASEIYSSDKVILGKYFFQNRTNIHYYELSPVLLSALKATEDVRFDDHSGVDLRGLLRVVLFAGKAGGGSTITQQLAKKLFHDSPDNKLERIIQKLQEWIISVQLERRYTKEEIIAMYLNTVDFSSNAYGIKSAAQTYFSKTPFDLNTQEAAMLIGMLKAPSRFNPVRNPKTSMDLSLSSDR